MTDPAMEHNVVNCGTFSGVIVQNLGDKILGLIRDAGVLREAIGVHSDSFISSLDI